MTRAPEDARKARKSEARVCAWCEREMEICSTGRPKIFCSSACKQAKYRADWSEERLEKQRQASKEYYAKNKDELLSKRRAYVAKNYGKCRASDARSYVKNAIDRRNAQREWTRKTKIERPEWYRKFLSRQSAASRKRAAERALSLLLLPAQPPSKE